MKELQLVDTTSKNTSTKSGRTKSRRVIVRVRTRAPAASSPEIPILSVLLKSPDNGMSTRTVIKEVTRRFDRLSEDDRRACYPESRKKIVDSVIKFARKNLVMKEEIFPAGEKNPIGVWKITPKGAEKVIALEESWRPRYSVHDAIIIEEEKK